MFRDIDLSKDIMVSFKQYMETREAPGGMDLTANVLMVSYWPTYPAMAVNLLPEVGGIGHVHVLSCLLIIYQYQPISMQFSRLSVENPIRF